MDGRSEAVEFAYLSWEDLEDIFAAILIFYNEFENAGRLWVPSVSNFRGENWGDGEQEYNALTVGWWGSPIGVRAVLNGTSSRGDVLPMPPNGSGGVVEEVGTPKGLTSNTSSIS